MRTAIVINHNTHEPMEISLEQAQKNMAILSEWCGLSTKSLWDIFKAANYNVFSPLWQLTMERANATLDKKTII